MDWTSVVRPRFDQPFWVGMGSMIGLGMVALRQGLFGKIRRADWMIGLLTLWAFLPMFLFVVGLLRVALIGALPLVLVAALGLLAFWLLKRFDHIFGVYYALNIAWAARRMALRDDPHFEELLASFQELVSCAQADEVVLVGHSIGGALAVRLFDQAPQSAVLLTVGRLRRLKWRGFDMHFLYFNAVEQLGPSWQWFDILTSKTPLLKRIEAEKRLTGTGERRGRF